MIDIKNFAKKNGAIPLNYSNGEPYFEISETELQAFADEYLLLNERQRNNGEAVGMVKHEIANDGLCGHVVWFTSPASMAQDTQLFTSPQQAIPAGFKLMPVNPTDAMVSSFKEHLAVTTKGSILNFKGAYKAMLSAAPTAPIERDK